MEKTNHFQNPSTNAERSQVWTVLLPTMLTHPHSGRSIQRVMYSTEIWNSISTTCTMYFSSRSVVDSSTPSTMLKKRLSLCWLWKCTQQDCGVHGLRSDTSAARPELNSRRKFPSCSPQPQTPSDFTCTELHCWTDKPSTMSCQER